MDDEVNDLRNKLQLEKATLDSVNRYLGIRSTNKDVGVSAQEFLRQKDKSKVMNNKSKKKKRGKAVYPQKEMRWQIKLSAATILTK